MEVCVGAAACLAVPVIYQKIRNFVPVTQNCWFCCKDQKVPYNERNGWVCKECDQYNGFKSDGDYNKKVPGQHSPLVRKAAERFCYTPTSRRDQLPSMNANGLCDKCNTNQEKMVEKIRMFEPINEDRWNAELSDYKYKLEQIYGLCGRCTMAAQRKMMEDKKQYAHLLQIHHLGSSIFYGVRRGARKIYRKQWFCGGRNTEVFHALSCIIAFSLFLGNYQYLQMDADTVPSLSGFLPTVCLGLLTLIKDYGGGLAIAVIAMEISAHRSNKCRTIFTDLVNFPVCCVLIFCAFYPLNDQWKEDIALSQCAFSAFLAALTAATWLLPRKMKHKKKPNTISSAFSVASTPMSQCSSQASSRAVSPLNTSPSLIGRDRSICTSAITPNVVQIPRMWDKAVSQETENKENELPNVSTIGLHANSHSEVGSFVPHLFKVPSHTNKFSWREREETPTPGRFDLSADMEWEPSVVDFPNPLPPRLAAMRESARMNREETPSREIGGLLGGLRLDRNKENEAVGKGPFGSLPFHPAVQRSYSESNRDPAWDGTSQISTFTSVSQRKSNLFATNSRYERRAMLNDSPNEGSVMTSVSQMTPSPRNLWNTLTVAVVVFSFILNILLFYYVISNKK